MTAKPAGRPRTDPVLRRTSDFMRAAVSDALRLLESMEQQDALRLPFAGYNEVMARLRKIVGRR